MQKAMQLLEQRDNKLIDVARLGRLRSPTLRSVRRSSELSGSNPGEYLKRGFEGHGNVGIAEGF